MLICPQCFERSLEVITTTHDTTYHCRKCGYVKTNSKEDKQIENFNNRHKDEFRFTPDINYG